MVLTLVRLVLCSTCAAMTSVASAGHAGVLAQAQTTRQVTSSITVTLPQDDAELTVDDAVVAGTGVTRKFQSPPTAAGATQRLTFTVRWAPNSYTTMTRSRVVSFRAGSPVTVDLSAEAPTDRVRVIYVPTPDDIAQEMVKLAGITSSDVVFEPGCGDARMLIAAVRAGARRGVGIDIDPERVDEARAKVKEAGLADRIEIRLGDALDVPDMSQATVVLLYMGDHFNMLIRPILWKALPIGARVVSHRFEMGDWKPDTTTRLPGSDGIGYELHLWTITAAVKRRTMQWAPQTSGVTARLRGVSAVSDTVAWASGSGSTILRTTDGGASWSRLAPPSPDRLDFRDVDAVSETTAYVLSIGNGPASRIFKTTDAGATWTQQYVADDKRIFLDAMAFSSRDRGVVAGDSIDNVFFLLTTEDGGATWTRVPPDRLPPALPNEGFFAASGTNVALLGDRIWIGSGAAGTSRVLRSADRGRTWRIANTPLTSDRTSGIYSIAFRDALHGVVVGGNYERELEAVNNAAVTADGGETWTLVRGLSGFRSVVTHVPGTTSTWIAIGPRGSDISTDDGRTWTPLEGPGLDTFSFAPGKPFGWGAGAKGALARFDGR